MRMDPFYFVLWLVEDSIAALSVTANPEVAKITLVLEVDAFAKAE